MWADPATAALLSWPTLGIVWLGAFVGAVASGGAGFAFALAASSLWLHVLDPVRSTLMVVACSVLLQLFTLWPLRRHIDRRRVWPFIAGGLVGIPVGVQLLAHTGADALKTALGIFLILFGSYAVAAPRLPLITAGGQAADAAVGVAGGVLGGLGGYSGVLPTIWTQLRGWPKDTARGVYQPFIIVAQSVTLVLVGMVALDTASVLLFLATLPPLVAGALLGWKLYGHLDDRLFRKLLAALLVVSGLALVI
jgi:uncharacterized membrane protein YfcA